MKIRKAEKKDIPRILALLGQVLQIHAELRPDIFIPGTTKYTPCELTELLEQEDQCCPSNHCLSMTFALTSRHGGSISGKACLNM